MSSSENDDFARGPPFLLFPCLDGATSRLYGAIYSSKGPKIFGCGVMNDIQFLSVFYTMIIQDIS